MATRCLCLAMAAVPLRPLIFRMIFNKGVSEHTEKKFNFQCLNDNVATVMAVANDIGFDEVFRFQLIGHMRPGDVVLAISGSGNSKNVLNADGIC